MHLLPAAALVAPVLADLAVPRTQTILGLVAISPLVAATLVRRRAVVVYAMLAVLAALLLGVWDGQYSGPALAAQVLRLVGVAAAGVLGLVAATIRLRRDRLLADASLEAAQARDAVALVTRLQ